MNTALPHTTGALMRLGLLAGAALLSACAPLRHGTDLPTRWAPSPNFDARRPSVIVLHHTGDNAAAPALRTLRDPQAQVSAHYLVARDGTLHQLVDERMRAWHAGESRWGTTPDLNSASIGIELDNNGAEPYPPPQIDSLLRLLDDLRTRYRIPAANVVGHGDVAPGRKVDPAEQFPWRALASHGFGVWCDPPHAPAPPGFDPLLGLRALGYDTRRPESVIAAFARHHAPAHPPGTALDVHADLIHCLLGKTEAPP